MARKQYKAAAVVAAGTMGSRLLGLLRDVLMAAAFGLGADLFYVAFTIPNLFRRLLGEGALHAAYLPVVAEVRQEAGDDEADAFSRRLLTRLTLLLGGLSLLLCGAGYGLGRWGGEETAELGCYLQLMSPFLLLICLAGFTMAMLNDRERFAVPSLSPAVMNLVWILGATWVLWQGGGLTVIALSVVVGGAAMLLWHLLALRRAGFRLRPQWDHQAPAVNKVVSRLREVAAGLGVLQLNILCDRLIAWLLVPVAGAVSALYFANRLVQLPYALIGLALGTAFLPRLSAQAARSDRSGFAATLRDVLARTVFLSVPAAVGLMVLAAPLIQLVFGRGAMAVSDVSRTAWVLVGLAPVVACYSAMAILSRGFYALGDARTPVRCGVEAFGVNLALNLVLAPVLGAFGLALATTIGATCQTLTMGWRLFRRLDPASGTLRLGTSLLRTAALSVVMVICCLAVRRWLPGGSGPGPLAFQVAVPSLVGLASYLGLAVGLRFEEVRL